MLTCYNTQVSDLAPLQALTNLEAIDCSYTKISDLAPLPSKSYIWELENKNPPRPSAEKVARIASVLGVTSDYLVDPTEKTDVAEAADQAFFPPLPQNGPGHQGQDQAHGRSVG